MEECTSGRDPVMAGPEPAISVGTVRRKMAGSSPAMTLWQRCDRRAVGSGGAKGSKGECPHPRDPIMAGTEPAISVGTMRRKMAGSSPAMTLWQRCDRRAVGSGGAKGSKGECPHPRDPVMAGPEPAISVGTVW